MTPIKDDQVFVLSLLHFYSSLCILSWVQSCIHFNDAFFFIFLFITYYFSLGVEQFWACENISRLAAVSRDEINSFPVWLRNICLIPVLSHTEKSCMATYYWLCSTNDLKDKNNCQFIWIIFICRGQGDSLPLQPLVMWSETCQWLNLSFLGTSLDG